MVYQTGSASISYSQMRNKKLSFVVDYHSFSADRDNSTAHIDAEVRWKQGNTTQVGNFRGMLHIHQEIGMVVKEFILIIIEHLVVSQTIIKVLLH